MKITVIGCGWLGLPLSVSLINNGNVLYGSTSSQIKLNLLNDLGINAFVYSEGHNSELPLNVVDSDIVIINFPPSKSSNYAQQIGDLIAQFATKTKIIFTSSTSVYEDVNGKVNESANLIENHPVRLAEKIIQNNNRPYCILRLSGLIGAGRHPIYFLQGKSALSGGEIPVNLVHLKDVISAIESVISSNKFKSIYNLSYPNHPSKKDYYPLIAEKIGLEAPTYLEDTMGGKEIDGNRITVELGFRYINPIDSAI